jgi:type VI secretion system secreted protein VgrG
MWFFSANEAQFVFSVSGCDQTLGVLRFSGTESLGSNYTIEIDTVCESGTLDLIRLQHQTACLTIQSPHQPRYIHGIVLAGAHIKSDDRYHHYRFQLVPQAELLRFRTNQRIFQNKSVPEIISAVWQTAGFQTNGLRLQTQKTFPALTYCVQYQETDLHFIQRLCEEHGLFYYFEHGASQHVMVFVDGKENCPKTSTAAVYQPGSGQNPDTPVLTELDWQARAATGIATVKEYDFTRPSSNLTGRKSVSLQEWYEYGTKHQTSDDGAKKADLWLQQQRHEQQRLYAAGTVRHAYPGCFLPITQATISSLNTDWLVVSIHHQGEQPQVLQELGDGSSKYHSQLTLHSKELPFYLPRTHQRPTPAGFQTALVTGPENEEIYTDSYGRIKVQFHWDKQAAGDETTSCWLRVAQGWAGSGFGQYLLPRIGQEVLVTFLEQDIDRPYVIGCVYNSTNTSPVTYPANQSQSGIRTLSSPNGDGFNELRFEDKKGQEQVVLHAERNWYRKVKATSRTEIGHDEHNQIGGKELTHIQKQEHLTIHKLRNVEIDGNQDLHVGQNKHLHINQKWLVKSDQSIHIRAGQTLILEADSVMNLDAGGSALRIDSSSIKFKGAIKMNSGGAASAALTPALNAIIAPAVLSAIQLATLQKKAPFCEECEKCKDGACAI